MRLLPLQAAQRFNSSGGRSEAFIAEDTLGGGLFESKLRKVVRPGGVRVGRRVVVLDGFGWMVSEGSKGISGGLVSFPNQAEKGTLRYPPKNTNPNSGNLVA